MPSRLKATLVVAAMVLVSAGAAVPASAGDFTGVYADDAFFRSPAYRSISFEAQAANGVQIVREPFDWRRIETSLGQYDFADYDDLVLRASAAGLAVLPVLGNPPGFRALTATSDSLWSPPASNAAFAVFAATLVARYGPGGSLWAE